MGVYNIAVCQVYNRATIMNHIIHAWVQACIWIEKHSVQNYRHSYTWLKKQLTLHGHNNKLVCTALYSVICFNNHDSNFGASLSHSLIRMTYYSYYESHHPWIHAWNNEQLKLGSLYVFITKETVKYGPILDHIIRCIIIIRVIKLQ